MNTIIVLFAITLFALNSVAVPAQGIQTAQAVPAGAERVISLNLNNSGLLDAVETIIKQSGVSISFRRELLESITVKHITLQSDRITVRDAFARVLAGTGLELRRLPSGGLAVLKARGGVADGVITGKVADAKTGKGVSGANVSLGVDNRGVTTDEDGSYRLSGVSVGAHTVTVRLVGYAKQTRSVTVSEGATVIADFKLEPSASVLDQVVVTGTVVSSELRSVPNAITVITAKQIEERGITRIDQLFRGDIPGLFSLNLGSNSLLDEVTMFSRGATAIIDPNLGVSVSAGTSRGTNPIKTYVDGVELADSKYLSQIDPSSIERIEILTGPQASTIYGANAINGVMQIFTKRGSSSRPQFSLSLSSGVAQNNFSSHLAPSHVADARVSGVEGRISYNVGSSWNYAGSWTPSKQTQRLSNNGGGRMEWARLTADVSARHGMTQNRQNGSQVQGNTDLRATGVFSYLSGQGLPTPTVQTLLGQTLGFSLGFRPFSWWSHDVGFGSDASTTETIVTAPGLTTLADTTFSISPSTTSRISERYTTTMQLPLSSLARLNLTLGGDHWRTQGSSWSVAPISLTGSSLRSPSDSRTHPSKNSGAFVQGQFSIKDALFFTYGLRADWNPSFGDKAKVKPGRYGVSFARDIGPLSAKLRGSYGRSIRPPSAGLALATAETNSTRLSLFGPFDRILANPDLGPEHQQGGEGGIELYLGSRASLIITRYNQTVDNLISLVGNPFSAALGGGLGLDSVRSLAPQPATEGNCNSTFRDDDGHCYRYQQQYLNVGSIRNQGWELTSSLNLGPLTTHGTYSWTKSRVLGITPRYSAILTGSVFQPGRSFDYVPEHTWALGVSYAHSQSSLSLSVNGIGMRYVAFDAVGLVASSLNRFSSSRPRMSLTASEYRPLGSGYVTSDLNATHRFSSRIDATLQVSNLTNHYQNDLRADYAALGRQTRLGARWRFQ